MPCCGIVYQVLCNREPARAAAGQINVLQCRGAGHRAYTRRAKRSHIACKQAGGAIASKHSVIYSSVYALTGLESGKFFPREPFVLPLDTRLFQRPAYRLGSAREVEVREDELGTHAAGRSEVIRCAWCRKVFFCSVPTVCAVSWVGVGVQNSRNGRKAC